MNISMSQFRRFHVGPENAINQETNEAIREDDQRRCMGVYIRPVTPAQPGEKWHPPYQVVAIPGRDDDLIPEIEDPKMPDFTIRELLECTDHPVKLANGVMMVRCSQMKLPDGGGEFWWYGADGSLRPCTRKLDACIITLWVETDEEGRRIFRVSERPGHPKE